MQITFVSDWQWIKEWNTKAKISISTDIHACDKRFKGCFWYGFILTPFFFSKIRWTCSSLLWFSVWWTLRCSQTISWSSHCALSMVACSSGGNSTSSAFDFPFAEASKSNWTAAKDFYPNFRLHPKLPGFPRIGRGLFMHYFTTVINRSHSSSIPHKIGHDLWATFTTHALWRLS